MSISLLPTSLAEPLRSIETEETWWKGSVIYQIYPRSFRDSSGNGVGDLRGIADGLGYVADLGVDAIWICPFFRSPMKDFGYDVSDYCDVDPLFGTLADFDRLLARAHRLGLKIIIDQVWSHSSEEHPWFAESRLAREGEKAQWYVWADAKPDGSPPNNWLSVFGGGAWSWEPRRRQYYLHHFLPSQPAFNLRHPAATAALLETGRFWLERGVDGFRLDAVDFMFHDPQLRDNPVRDLSGLPPPTRPFGMQRHQHDMLHPDLLPFFTALRKLLGRYRARASLGEISSEPGAFERCAVYTDPREARLDMAYTLDLMKRELKPESFLRALEEARARSGDACICWAFSNHDVVRAASRWGGEGAGGDATRLLLALLFSLPGSACLYQGEELGLPQAELSPDQMVDPYGIAFYPVFKGRDGARTPMPWQDAAPNAGFSTAARPWLPVPPEHLPLAVSRQEADPDSMLNFTRRFLQWRRRHPALRRGSVRPLGLRTPLLGFERQWNGERILALFNLGGTPVDVSRGILPSFEPLPEHGFRTAVNKRTVRMRAYDAFFARILT